MWGSNETASPKTIEKTLCLYRGDFRGGCISRGGRMCWQRGYRRKQVTSFGVGRRGHWGLRWFADSGRSRVLPPHYDCCVVNNQLITALCCWVHLTAVCLAVSSTVWRHHRTSLLRLYSYSLMCVCVPISKYISSDGCVFGFRCLHELVIIR